MIPKGLSVALVEPRYPVNLGHVARLVKNFGVRRLYLINPQVDMSVASVYASHGGDVLEKARVVSFSRLRRESQLLVATTAVRARKGSNVARRTVRPERVSEIVRTAGTSVLVFGRDSTGLTNEEIAACDVTTVIDTGTEYRTLNLGHSVAIMLYLVSSSRARARALQSMKARELFAGSFHTLAAEAGLPVHKAGSMGEVGKRIAASAGLSDRQLHLMTGVFRKAASRLKDQRLDSKA